MGTHCNIAIEQANGQANVIYCHYDGYPEHTLEILKEHYNRVANVVELILLGDISFLAKYPNPKGDNHSFKQPEKDIVVAYGRDRGEDTPYRIVANADKFCEEEFGYIFTLEGKWEQAL